MSHIPLHWRSSCGNYTVEISKRAFRDMLRLAREHAPQEVGTSLIGSYSEDGYRAIIRALAPLTEDSRGSRFSFVRGVSGLECFFSRLFRRFRGRRHYVGEWHSHPGGTAIPSSIDDKNQRAIVNDDGADCAECILVILGGTVPHASNLGVFVYSRRCGRTDLHPAAI